MASFGFLSTASNQLRAWRHSTYRLSPSSSFAAVPLSETTINLSTGRENCRDIDEPSASTRTTSTATGRASRLIGFDGHGEGTGVHTSHPRRPSAVHRSRRSRRRGAVLAACCRSRTPGRERGTICTESVRTLLLTLTISGFRTPTTTPPIRHWKVIEDALLTHRYDWRV